MYLAAYNSLMILAFSAFAAFAQSSPDTGQITGVVKDPDQAAVSGSQVTLTNQQTKAKALPSPTAQGAYAFPSLPPGVLRRRRSIPRVSTRARAPSSTSLRARPSLSISP